MKTRNTPKPKLLIPLLLVLISAPALASDSVQGIAGGAVTGVFGGLFGPAIAQVAQFNAEERRAMRERWEQASPEERLQMRREFKERSRQIPSDSRRDGGERDYQRDYQRDNQRDAQSHKQRQRGKYADEASFGFGFERRRYEDDRIENPPPGNVPAPFEFFDRRDHRDKNRDGRRDDDRR